jgi:hypothetical protein
MMIHCRACGITSPRDLAELAQPSDRSCLVCGARLADKVVSSAKLIAFGTPGRRRRHGPAKHVVRRIRSAQVHGMQRGVPAAR